VNLGQQGYFELIAAEAGTLTWISEFFLRSTNCDGCVQPIVDFVVRGATALLDQLKCPPFV